MRDIANILTETDGDGVALYEVLFDEGKGKGKGKVNPSKRWKVLKPRDEGKGDRKAKGKDKVNVKARTKWLRSMNPWRWIL